MVPKHLKIYIFSLEHFHLLVFILFWDGNILIFWNALVSWKMFPVKLLSRLPLYVLFSPGRLHLEESRSLSMQDLHDLKDCRKELKSWFHNRVCRFWTKFHGLRLWYLCSLQDESICFHMNNVTVRHASHRTLTIRMYCFIFIF